MPHQLAWRRRPAAFEFPSSPLFTQVPRKGVLGSRNVGPASCKAPGGVEGLDTRDSGYSRITRRRTRDRDHPRRARARRSAWRVLERNTADAPAARAAATTTARL